MMQRLVLRHEDSINLLKLEYSFVAQMKIGMPASVFAMLYVAADGWRKLKANEPEKLDRPMRTSLFVCFFAEFKARLTGLEEKPDDIAKMAQLGWLAPGRPLTWQFLKWDPVAQRNVVDSSKPPLTSSEVMEHVNTLLANVVATNSLARFHPTRPLTGDMQGDNVVFLIQVGNVTDWQSSREPEGSLPQCIASAGGYPAEGGSDGAVHAREQHCSRHSLLVARDGGFESAPALTLVLLFA